MDQNSNVSQERLIKEMKRKLRNDMREKRDNESKIIRTEKDRQILRNFVTSTYYHSAEYILCYAGYSSEVSTERIMQMAIADKKKVYAPKMIDSEYMEFYKINKVSELSISSYGIPEPNESEIVFEPSILLRDDVKCCLVIPGLAFDRKMHRMGYGKGYYDKYLSKQMQAGKMPMKDHIFKVALCYDFQFMDIVPVEPGDISMDCVITEKGVFTS